MLPYYKQHLNAHGMHAVDRGIDIPDPQLGVGFAELHDPIRIVLKVGNQRKATYNPVVKEIEKTTMNGQGNPVKMEDFPKLYYFGDPLGEV